jgi:phenylacetate-CoA ligase
MRRDPGWAATCATLLRRRTTRARLDAFRDRRVRHLVAHAYEHVAHYRQAMRAHGVTPGDIQGVGDLHRLPILEKPVLQDRWRSLLADGVDPDRLSSIESTGRNVMAYHAPAEWLMLGALRYHADRRFGRTARMPTARVAMIRGGKRPTRRLRIARALGWFRSTNVDGRLGPDHVVAELRRLRPAVVVAFPVTLMRASEVAGPAGLADLGVRLVVVGGAMVTPQIRRTIAEAFAAPVFETYNCVELFHLAGECPATGALHVCEENVVLEVLRGDRPAREGETGEVVVTALHQYALPLIRYRLGDVVTMGAPACACGDPHSTIRRVEGRRDDHFRLPGGRFVYPWRLTKWILGSHEWIADYRIIQERVDRVRLLIVPRGDPPEGEIDGIHRYCTGMLGLDVSFDVELVDRLPDDGRLKPRFSVSHVVTDYAEFDWERLDGEDDDP